MKLSVERRLKGLGSEQYTRHINNKYECVFFLEHVFFHSSSSRCLRALLRFAVRSAAQICVVSFVLHCASSFNWFCSLIALTAGFFVLNSSQPLIAVAAQPRRCQLATVFSRAHIIFSPGPPQPPPSPSSSSLQAKPGFTGVHPYLLLRITNSPFSKHTASSFPSHSSSCRSFLPPSPSVVCRREAPAVSLKRRLTTIPSSSPPPPQNIPLSLCFPFLNLFLIDFRFGGFVASVLVLLKVLTVVSANFEGIGKKAEVTDEEGNIDILAELQLLLTLGNKVNSLR
ncbi:hypothetical protein PIB30_006070 [Stylosanthes scabra]|uniref:Uncharacterized protein n=1 Tax=Stylosanthes scabra TaxID=79078 RepID=A0ABU6V2I8_9FABA|nr:hypothetical protein [Stylosanthes scabra]